MAQHWKRRAGRGSGGKVREMRPPVEATVSDVLRSRMAGSSKQMKFPRWAALLGAFAVTLIGYVGARGGPEAAWQEIAETFGYVKPPHIVSLQPKSAGSLQFVVSIENPSLRKVQITAYEAIPSIQLAAAINPASGAGSLPLMKVEADSPVQCQERELVHLSVPLIIEPKSSGGIEVTPWAERCDFSFRVMATSGTSPEAYWAPLSDALIRELGDRN